MTSEPPPEYVAFVTRHLEPLRREAAKVVGGEQDADRLYPDVLVDVAARWGWLELLRTRFGNAAAADAYLDRAFARLSQRWEPDNVTGGVEVIDHVKAIHEVPAIREVEVIVWQDDGWQDNPWQDGPWQDRVWQEGPWPDRVAPTSAPTPALTSNAVRLAPLIVAPPKPHVGPACEAAIAWWHAYEVRRRRMLLAAAAAVLILFGILAHFSTAPV
jgi:hypothetical protein